MAYALGAKEKTGFRLLVMAWAVEILAALVGLTIAVVTGLSIYDQMGRSAGALPSATLINVALGSLPFLMVAVVEITKIPLVLVFFTQRSCVGKLSSALR